RAVNTADDRQRQLVERAEHRGGHGRVGDVFVLRMRRDLRQPRSVCASAERLAHAANDHHAYLSRRTRDLRRPRGEFRDHLCVDRRLCVPSCPLWWLVRDPPTPTKTETPRTSPQRLARCTRPTTPTRASSACRQDR